MTPARSSQLGITTSGWFEVEVFEHTAEYPRGAHCLRRHVETIEEASELLRLFHPAPEPLPGQTEMPGDFDG